MKQYIEIKFERNSSNPDFDTMINEFIKKFHKDYKGLKVRNSFNQMHELGICEYKSVLFEYKIKPKKKKRLK